MNDEIKEILVISNSPARDIQEFSRYCKSYIDKCESHKIYMKDGYILRFHSSHNLVGVRKYYLYHEIFETYLKNHITNLQQKIERLEKSNNNRIDEIVYFRDKLSEYEKENESLKEDRKYLLEYNNEDYKSRCEKANKELINSKEYQIAIAMELNDRQSVLIKLDNILNGRSDE